MLAKIWSQRHDGGVQQFCSFTTQYPKPEKGCAGGHYRKVWQSFSYEHELLNTLCAAAMRRRKS